VSPLSLLTFFAAAKKVSAAPHRGNAGEPKANRGCQQKAQKQRTATASQKKNTKKLNDTTRAAKAPHPDMIKLRSVH
jgi:general secretion pathway protein K